VEEIEAVRDRRIDQLQSRAAVTQRYLDNLHERLAKLEREEKWYGRVNPDTGEAGEVPAEVIKELAATRASITDYEGRMQGSAAEQQGIEEKFAKDIARFRELKGLPPEDEETAGAADGDQSELAATAAKSGAE
jgi:sugar-specific transcriptional regulator TrmB